jgi:3-isopropylmalate dehydrogenase
MKARIAVLPGDGIGPEVIAQGLACLRAIAAAFGHDFELTEFAFGGAAIDRHGEPLPAATLAACRAADAVLLGAIGGPRWSAPEATVRPEQGLLALRKALGAFANSPAASTSGRSAAMPPVPRTCAPIPWPRWNAWCASPPGSPARGAGA